MPSREKQITQKATTAEQEIATLVAREKRIRLALSAGRIYTWDWNIATDSIVWSGGLEKELLFCQPPGDVAAFRALVHPDDADFVSERIQAAIEGPNGYEAEFRMVRSDGSVRWTYSRAIVVRDDSGRAVRMVGVDQDVTERHELLRRTTESEARLRACYGSLAAAETASKMGSWDWDISADRVYVSDAYRALYGLDPDIEVNFETWLNLILPEDREEVLSSTQRHLETGSPLDIEFRINHPTGGIRWVAGLGQATRDDSGTPTRFAGVNIDITHRKQRAEALPDPDAMAESEARLRLATKAGGVGVFDWNVRTGEITWDERMRELWALPAGFEVRLESFFESLHPEDREWVKAANLAALDPAGSGQYEAEYRIIGATDGRERRVAAHGKVTFENGAATRMVGTVVDRTALRMAEAVLARDRAELEALVTARTQVLQQTQARLAQAEKLTALGQLAGGLAHDFNNVLQAVQFGARLIDRKPEDPDNVRRLARMVLDAAERGSSVSRRLLSFARQGDLRATPVDPASLLHELQEVLAHTLGAGVAITVHAPADLPPMFVDKGQLETVLINLAANARDAMAGTGALTFAAEVDRVEGSRAEIALSLKPGAYLRFSVRDTGAGMSPEVLARATEPFFTTKANGQGTGLGLATARGFVEQSGGGMRIESAPGEGTVVTLWLPLATHAAVPVPLSSETGAPAERRTIRLVVVDDDPLVRALLAEQLRSADYDVTACPDAAMALSLLDAGESFDLMIADLSMPGMDGVALIREACLRRPRMPSILLTGYAAESAEVRGTSADAFTILRKPAPERQLTECVEMLLRLGTAANGAI